MIGLLLATGCQQADRLRECRAIADSVNPELGQLAHTFTPRGSISTIEYKTASAAYLRSAKRLQDLHPSDSELARLSRDMSEVLMSASRSCDRFAAMDDQHGSAQLAQRDFDTLANRHHSLIAAINRRCSE
jgi:hypothetical protein